MEYQQAPSPAQVSAATSAWLTERLGIEIHEVSPPVRLTGGFDFWIYGLQFGGTGVPDEWARPLVARLPPTPERFPLLEKESRLQDWAAHHGYPAPRVRALLPPGVVLPQPVQLVERVPGRPMADQMASRPWRIRALLTRMGSVQAALHQLPLPDWADAGDGWSVVERRLGLTRHLVERNLDSGLEAALEETERIVPDLEVHDPALCHGDFHPLNLLVDGASTSVIDWTDAGIGDRHADIARSSWLFGFAAAATGHRSQRLVLQPMAPVLSRGYLASYQRHLPIVTARIRLWLPLQILHGWAMAVADRAELFGPSRAGDEFASGMADWAQEQFRQAMADLS